MSDESLIAPKNPDGFTTESPIRAFTEFQVNGLYAIGKGFRPSLAHMTAYMSAMETKEGWQFVQVILPRDNDGEPTMLFRKIAPPMYIMQTGEIPPLEDIYKALGDRIFDGVTTEREARASEVFAMPYGFQRTKDLRRGVVVRDDRENLDDDPIHPKHYDGVACCEIIDHMPTNVGLAGKYIWRLGEKDPMAQEIGKLIFYLKRQILLIEGKHAGFGRSRFGFGDPEKNGQYQDYAAKRIAGRFHGLDYGTERATAMTGLVYFTTSGNTSTLHNAIRIMDSIRKDVGITTGLAV